MGRVRIIDRRQHLPRVRVAGPRLDADRALPHSRKKLIDAEHRGRGLGQAQALQSGERQERRVSHAFFELAQPRLDIAAQRHDLQIRPVHQHLGTAAQGRGADPAPRREGGEAQAYPLVLGSGSFIPGFEEQLVGAKAGDSVNVNVRFPDDYGAPHLKGKDAVFETTVHAVKSPKAAEIDDELAKRFGADSLDDLKTQITERLGAEYQGASRALMKRALLDRLDELVSFDLPESLVEAEAAQIAHQLWHEEHPEEHGHNHGSIEPTDEHKKLAERRVRLGLLLADVGQKAEIGVTDQEMTQAVMRQARNFPGQERAFFEFIQQNEAAQQQLRAPIFEDKVVDHIISGAKVTEKSVTKEELEKALESLDEI